MKCRGPGSLPESSVSQIWRATSATHVSVGWSLQRQWGVGTPGPWPAPCCGEAAGPLGFLTTGRHRLPVPPSFHVCVCLPAADLAHWTWASLMASLELAGLREPRSAPTPTPPRAAGVRTLTCERRGPTGMTKLPVDRATQSSQPMTPRVRLCNKPVEV